jgi:hypothetical protein
VDPAVTAFLSQAWLDAWRVVMAAVDDEGGPRPSARVALSVPGAPGGDTTIGFVLLDGGVVEAGAGPLAEPDITLTAPHALALEIARGEVTASAAYMQGRLKTAGDPGRLLELLSWSHRAARREALAKLATDTDF